MLAAWCVCAALVVAAAVVAEDEAARALAGAARWAVASTVLLGDAAAPGAELGYRLAAALTVRARPAVGADPPGLLLHFTLDSPQLMLRGKHRNAEFLPKPSLWDSMPSSEFLAVWSEGHITEAYLDPGDPPDVLDYKKALISLFQFQVQEGERNETDVSGDCHVHYDAVSNLVLRKSKMVCRWQGAADEDENDACAERRRVVRYERGAGGELRTVSADEVLLLRGADTSHALKARALHVLTRAEHAPAPAGEGAGAGAGEGEGESLAAARARLPALAPTPLPLDLRADTDPEPKESLTEALSVHRAALEEARAGSAEAAEAALRLVPALRAATAGRLAAALDHADADELAGLAAALGLAGARGAHAAARDKLQLGARAPPREDRAREYLAALALAPEVDEEVVRDTLKLGLTDGALAGAALLAAAAAAPRGPDAAARLQLVLDVKNDLTRTLAKCKDDGCAAARLLALAQLRRPELGELFVRHAERGARGAALAALAGLHALGPEGCGAQQRRLERVVLALGAPRPLDVRARALRLALAAAADRPLRLVYVTRALRHRGPRELRRLCWQQLLALAAGRAPLAAALRALDPRPRDWLRRAHDGTSSVLSRAAGWARLESAQLAAAGVLRRGRVALAADTREGDLHLLTVEVWTRGLESFATPPAVPAAAREQEDEPGGEGAGAEGEDGDEAVEGGLALTVHGVRRPDLTLFSGQGELLGHIWAGTASAPTGVLRALVPRPARAHAYASQAGVVVRARVRRAAALALAAQAQVSLWGRTARAGLALRGAGVELAELRLRTAWGAVRAAARAALEPRLTLAAALDFYDEPQLCVHTALPDHTYSRNVTLESELGASRLRVRRSRLESVPAPGRTLALGAPNDAACAALGADHRD